MGVTDFFAGEIVTELLKTLLKVSRKSLLCKSTAESLTATINELYPIIQEAKFSGVELPALRQSQLDRLSETLRDGLDLAEKVLRSKRWNVYKNLQLARKMERLEKRVSMFISGPMQAHVMADVHHLRFESAERFDRLERRLGEMRVGGAVAGVVKKEVEEEGERLVVGDLVGGVGVEDGKSRVKELVMMDREEVKVVGIVGIGGSGKTTLVSQVCRDDQVRCYFKERILFLTVSQSPDLDNLKAKIRGFVSGTSGGAIVSGQENDGFFPNWNGQYSSYRVEGVKKLIVLDDVWSLSHLEQLVFHTPGLKTLVVSRFRFPTVFNSTYEVQLLRESEAMTLFCLSAFGQRSVPLGADANLVKQILEECEGLPLALKVIGASLRDKPEMYWASAKKRLSRGEPICDLHKNKVLDRMAISVDFLPKKVKECFLDLGCFPEDKKIPLDVLINMWVEIHGFDNEEAFAVLVELADKNLVTLVKDPRAGDVYSCYYDISVTQHDVLRDLAIHLSGHGEVTERSRLLMPRRETELPREWEKSCDQPFYAQIVSIHTGEMGEMDWPSMEFPKAEVLILNFAGKEYFLPPFIGRMRKLRALIVINYTNSNATVGNFSVFSNLANLRSLWLEKVSLARLTASTGPLKKLRKMSLILCKIEDGLGFDRSVSENFPSLLELTIDHCDDMFKLPPGICALHSLKSLSITNCHNLHVLPSDLGDLTSLRILRLYACPTLKTLPPSVCDLPCLKYLDISQCVSLKSLPEEIGRLSGLEKIDMRECPQVWDLPRSAASLQSLRLVICDEEVSWSWKDAGRSNLHVQVAEKCFSLDWLDE